MITMLLPKHLIEAMHLHLQECPEAPDCPECAMYVDILSDLKMLESVIRAESN